MRSMLGSLSVLLAVISTGHSLLCTQCAGSNSYPCNGDNITCPSDSVCGATYTLTGVGDAAESIKSYARECVPRKECDMAGSISLLAGIKILLGRSCCYTDLCLPAQPKLPAVSTKLNGLVCPACVSEDSTWCNPNDGTLRCTGSETACLMQTVNLQGFLKTAVRGCGTKRLCDLGNQTAETPFGKLETTYTCGAAGLYSGFSFATFVVILLSNLLS